MSSIERQEDNRKQKKELRREYPSGWFHFTQHDAVPILVDALLALSRIESSPRPNSPSTRESRDRPSVTTPICYWKPNSSRRFEHVTASLPRR